MYQAPQAQKAGDAHLSTSLSVYLPLESDFGFNRENSSEAPQTILGSQSLNSARTFHTYVTANSGDDSFLPSNSRDPSFTSINESLLRNNSVELFENTLPQPTVSYDDDATPKLGQTSTYLDPLDDTTPLVDAHGFLPTQEPSQCLSVELSPRKRASLLPHQELNPKFQRLSMTLQHSTVGTSDDSFQFMSSFQQNIDRVNTASNAAGKPNNRTSNYYRKIHESQPPDDDTTESLVSNADAQSEASSVSNRSSVISYEGEAPVPSGGHSIDEETNSSSSFYFNDGNLPSGGSSLGSSAASSSQNFSNFRGSRVSPLKIVKKSNNESQDEIPVRKDLVYKFEQTRTDNEAPISERQKNDLFIASRQPLLEKYPQGLNISFTDSILDPKNTDANNTVEDTPDTTVNSAQVSIPDSTTSTAPPDDEDLSSLFIRAIHGFNSNTLQSEADASICLSFEKDDLAFVHTIDDSGWGEVTLVESLQRGWIPMNYFTIAVSDEKDEVEEDSDANMGTIPNSSFLRPLFHACGKFLTNPLSHRSRKGKYTFSIRVVNSIRDGVRLLLQETDCLSRANEIVTKKPVVRKTRKTLLADWYNLMVKANEFKGTSNFNKIEILTLMIYQVIRKATAFLQIWSIESKQIVKRENEKKLQSDMNNYPLLASPPSAKQRVTEINGILFSYLGIIIGRLDLIEHNPVGCDILETLTHQIILLLRELLFISKTGSDFSLEKPADLDGSLDTLLSLVSDLVTGIKSLVMKTLNETEEERKHLYDINGGAQSNPLTDYYYTQEGGELIGIAGKMIKAISSTIASIRKLLEVTGDFKLNAERAYPDYSKMKTDPVDFIKKCSIGIAKSQSVGNRDLKALKQSQNSKRLNRYSMMRSGKTGELGLTSNGAHLLHDALITDFEGSSFSVSNAEFEPFTHTSGTALDGKHTIKDELLVDLNGNLLGASFKGLVYTLTNEESPPEYFFVSTFFICFRSFAAGIDLVEELIGRFDMGNTRTKRTDGDLSAEIKIKSRRRLVVKMFQLWLESYWNQEKDYALLTTLINFFNEGVSTFLPIEAIKLIEVAAKLSTRPLIENKKRSPKTGTTKQLITRSITVSRIARKNSMSNLHNPSSETLSSRYSMVDGYELSKINTNSSTSSSLKSMTLPMPLGVGNQTSSSSSLLSKNQMSTIEKVILTYRAILGESWCPQLYIDAKSYIPMDMSTVLTNWFTVCDQSWVLSNYRPNLLDFNGLEIAKQLTLIESHIFVAVRPDELLNENFTAKRAHFKLAPNVRQSLLFTNCLSGYVLESILQPKINQKLRVNMVKTWLKIAISCLYLRNFNSLAAIITALQSHLVTRLTRVWSELSEKYQELYEYLSGIIHPEKNYTVYRTKLRNFLVSNDYNIPIVPYFSLFLQDLTFVTDGNPNFRKANTFLNQKIINIDKYLKTTRIIADIESLQVPYTADPLKQDYKRSSLMMAMSGAQGKPESADDYRIIAVAPLQELILLELWKVSQLNRKEEDRAWKLSCLIQPRDA